MLALDATLAALLIVEFSGYLVATDVDACAEDNATLAADWAVLFALLVPSNSEFPIAYEL